MSLLRNVGLLSALQKILVVIDLAQTMGMLSRQLLGGRHNERADVPVDVGKMLRQATLAAKRIAIGKARRHAPYHAADRDAFRPALAR